MSSKNTLKMRMKKLTYDTPLISSGYVDSFSMVSLLVFLENKFKIKIPPGKATPEAFDSVNKIVASGKSIHLILINNSLCTSS